MAAVSSIFILDPVVYIMIKRRHRLDNKSIFRIFQKPNKNLYRSNTYLSILYSNTNQMDTHRFAVVVSKKIGKANIRYLIKRRLYSLIDQLILKKHTNPISDSMPSHKIMSPLEDSQVKGDYIIMIRPLTIKKDDARVNIGDTTYAEWKKILMTTWQQIQYLIYRRSKPQQNKVLHKILLK